jgi:hypothetical protein
MHVNFVPVTTDGRLSAKDVIGNRMELNNLQTQYHEQVAKDYGLQRGEEGSKTRHQTVAEYKVRTLQAQIKGLEVEKGNLEKQIVGQKEKETMLRSSIKGLEGAWMTRIDLDTIQPKETLTGAIKGVTVEQIKRLKKMAVEGLRIKADYAQLWEGYEKYKELYDNALKHLPTRDEKAQQRQDKERLAHLEKAFAKLPEETREQILPTKLKKHTIEQNHDLGH